jgi:hypothetical protein
VGEIWVIIAYIIVGAIIGYGIKSFLDSLRDQEEIKRINDRLDKYIELDEEFNKRYKKK